MFSINVDSLESELVLHEQINDLTKQLEVCRTLRTHYHSGNEVKEKYLDYSKKALSVAEQIGTINIIAVELLELGFCYRRINDFDDALKCFSRINDFPDASIEITTRTSALSTTAMIFQELGDYGQAYEFQLQALKNSEEIRDTNNIAVSLYRLGSIFFYQKNFEMALEHYEKALELSRIVQNAKLEYSALCALGSTYPSLGDREKSLKYLEVALSSARIRNDETGVFYALLNIGSSHLQINNLQESEMYLQEALTMSKKLENRWGQVGSLISLGELSLTNGKTKKAIEYLGESLKIAKEIRSKVRIVEIYGLLADAHHQTDEFKKAFDYLKMEAMLKDSILGEKTVKEMGTHKTRYEVQKRETEIALLKKEKEIANLNGYMLVGTAIFLLLLSGLLYSRIRVQKKSNLLLEEKNKKIFLQKEKLEEANERQKDTNKLLEQKNEQIHIQNKKLEESNDDLKQFAYVASHDLKEPLRMISSYTTLLDKRYKHLFDDTASEFFLYITDGVKRMETMLTDLLSYSRVNSQQKPAQPVKTGDVMEIVAATLRAKVAEAGGEIRFEPARLPIVMSNRTHMTQLFQNLVSNALKFMGGKKPLVEVDCVPQGDDYLFSVKDNGIGISPDNIDKIFEMFRRLHTKEEYEGTGIGLATVKKIIERCGGKIWVESEVGVGSTFFFTMPNPEKVAADQEASSKEPAMA
ncbi:MAG: tetratricopeptide repeat protein [Bacteroidota bacterium]